MTVWFGRSCSLDETGFAVLNLEHTALALVEVESQSWGAPDDERRDFLERHRVPTKGFFANYQLDYTESLISTDAQVAAIAMVQRKDTRDGLRFFVLTGSSKRPVQLSDEPTTMTS